VVVAMATVVVSIVITAEAINQVKIYDP